MKQVNKVMIGASWLLTTILSTLFYFGRGSAWTFEVWMAVTTCMVALTIGVSVFYLCEDYYL